MGFRYSNFQLAAVMHTPPKHLSLQHLLFTTDHLSRYSPGSTLLNICYRMITGVSALYKRMFSWKRIEFNSDIFKIDFTSSKALKPLRHKGKLRVDELENGNSIKKNEQKNE